MIRRIGLSLAVALMLVAAQASAVFGAASEQHSSCLAQFTSNQGPGEVAGSITGNLAEAHPIGLVIISFTAPIKSPCFGEEE